MPLIRWRWGWPRIFWTLLVYLISDNYFQKHLLYTTCTKKIRYPYSCIELMNNIEIWRINTLSSEVRKNCTYNLKEVQCFFYFYRVQWFVICHISNIIWKFALILCLMRFSSLQLHLMIYRTISSFNSPSCFVKDNNVFVKCY